MVSAFCTDLFLLGALWDCSAERVVVSAKVSHLVTPSRRVFRETHSMRFFQCYGQCCSCKLPLVRFYTLLRPFCAIYVPKSRSYFSDSSYFQFSDSRYLIHRSVSCFISFDALYDMCIHTTRYNTLLHCCIVVSISVWAVRRFQGRSAAHLSK